MPGGFAPPGFFLGPNTMTRNYRPPSSGLLLGALVDALRLRMTPALKSSTARSYFSGERISEAKQKQIVTDAIDGLLASTMLVLPDDPPPKAVLVVGLTTALRGWDETVARYMSAAPPLPNTEFAGRAFARLLTVDLCLRAAGLRWRCALGDVGNDLLLDEHQGCLVRRLLSERGLTREQAAERSGASLTSLDNWADGVGSIDDENIASLGVALEPSDEEKRRRLTTQLRRHFAFWRLKQTASVSLGQNFTAELLRAFVRITNALLKGLRGSKLGALEFTKALDVIIMLGRLFPSTKFLRSAVARVEEDRHWYAALVSDDLAYVEGHARQLAALPEAEALLAADGFRLPDEWREAFSDLPPMGMTPKRWRPPHTVAFITGDASFSANNREALSHAAELRNDLRGAIKEIEHALAHEPTNPMWHFRLAALLAKAGAVEGAISECRIASILAPGWDLPRIEIGIVLLAARRPAEALEALLLARSTFAPSAHLAYHLGLAHFDVGNLAEAEASLEEALRLKPHYPLALNMLSEVLFTASAAEEGTRARARKQRARSLAKEAAHFGVRRAMDRYLRNNGSDEPSG